MIGYLLLGALFVVGAILLVWGLCIAASKGEPK